MQELSLNDRAYVRPSPSKGTPGGIRMATRGAVQLCEAAGFNVVLVETVGVGQSEFAVSNIVDIVLLLVLPNAGDELQGIKQGILEAADIVAVTKADSGLEDAAKETLRQYRRVLAAPSSRQRAVPVLTCSAVTGDGIADLWTAIRKQEATIRASGDLEQNRRSQLEIALIETAKSMLIQALHDHCVTVDRQVLNHWMDQVEKGQISVSEVARRIAAQFLEESTENPENERDSGL